MADPPTGDPRTDPADVTAHLLASDPAGLTLHARLGPAIDGHAPGRHQELLTQPGGFCGPAAAVTALQIAGRHVTFEARPIPYCRLRRPRQNLTEVPPVPQPHSLGWNVTVTVTGHDRPALLVARRAPALNWGGRWHVTANEGTEPVDLPDDGPVDVTAIAGRALREELGIDLPPTDLAAVTVAHSLFAVTGTYALGVAVHVRLDTLGWTAEDVTASHRHADDGWEITDLVTVPATSRALERFATPDQWTPWARVCFDGALRTLTDLATAG